ncbi:MAG TPA: hypothetical protein DHU93_01805 [Algoriphagus sp.]|nr:hypothetical protein [Algoriphagus sp.]
MNITNVYRFIKLLIPPIITFQIQKYRRTQHNKKKGLFKPNNSLIESFSQYQEDLIIDAIFRKEKGFYVDVGANDPKNSVIQIGFIVEDGLELILNHNLRKLSFLKKSEIGIST